MDLISAKESLKNALYVFLPSQQIDLDDPDSAFTLDHPPNQLTALIKQDIISRASTEAREVLSLLLNAPNDLMEQLCFRGEFTIVKIGNYLRKKGWRRKDVLKAVRDLKQMKKELETI